MKHYIASSAMSGAIPNVRNGLHCKRERVPREPLFLSHPISSDMERPRNFVLAPFPIRRKKHMETEKSLACVLAS